MFDLAKVDYTPKLEITIKRANEKIEIMFQDNGVGMSESVQKHMFDPFFSSKDLESVF